MDRVDKPEELEKRTREFNRTKFGYCIDCEKKEWVDGLDKDVTF